MDYSATDSPVPEAPRSGVALPHVGASAIGRPDVTSIRRGRFVDFVRSEESRRPKIRRSDLFHEFVTDCAQRVTTFGYLNEMHVGVEVIEVLQLTRREIDRGIHAEQIDREGLYSLGAGLRDLSVQGRPGLTKPNGCGVFERVGFVFCVDIERGKISGRAKTAPRYCQ
jgi:hypothetical protein